MTTSGTTAVVIGRVQLPHLAHHHLIQAAFNLADRVVMVIGSSWRSRNPKNPFTFAERREMLLSTLSLEQQARIRFVGVRDVYNDKRWAAMVRDQVQACGTPDDEMLLVAHEKDATSYYLQMFPGWSYVDAGSAMAVDSTALRNILFGSKLPPSAALAEIAPYVHAGVLRYLDAWTQTSDYKARCDEHQANEAYKLKYPNGPYYTGDAIVEAAGRFLMIERDGLLGHGTFAWPGGHEEKGESGPDAALRELGEETTLPFSAAELRQFIVAERLFDAPGRSPRGRIITRACHIQLPGFTVETLPEVFGRDDAKKRPANWFTREEFAARMHRMFDDHCVIGEHFMGEMTPTVALTAPH